MSGDVSDRKRLISITGGNLHINYLHIRTLNKLTTITLFTGYNGKSARKLGGGSICR